MKNVCKIPCTECVHSFNSIICLAPQFELDVSAPITEVGLKKILAVLQKRLILGSSIYENNFGKGQWELDFMAVENIEGILRRDFSN